ncbi:MAG: phosphatase PAP2 family protein [Candidatus Paceibacterota bacterium]|jgi:undecaprenyl-diphosphatase
MQRGKIIFLIVLIAIFLIIGWLVATKNPQLINIDHNIISYFDNLRFPALDTTMLAITKVGNPRYSFVLFLIFAIILIIKRKAVPFYIFTIATILCSILPPELKTFFERTRPTGGLLKLRDYSFPSGHATISAVFLLSALFIFAPLIKNNLLKWLFITASTILFTSVALSRIFLWVHWPSDVLAGFILGTICYLLVDVMCCHKNENML